MNVHSDLAARMQQRLSALIFLIENARDQVLAQKQTLFAAWSARPTPAGPEDNEDAFAKLKSKFLAWQQLAQTRLPHDFNLALFLLCMQMLLLSPILSVTLLNAELQHYRALSSTLAGLGYTVLMLLGVIASVLSNIWGAIHVWREREWRVLQNAARLQWFTGPLAVVLLQVLLPGLLLNAEGVYPSQFGLNFAFSLSIAGAWTLYLSCAEAPRRLYHGPQEFLPVQKLSELEAVTTEVQLGNKALLYILLLFAVILYCVLQVLPQKPITVKSRAVPKSTELLAQPSKVIANPSSEIAVTLPAIAVGDSYVMESQDLAHPSHTHQTLRRVLAVYPLGFTLAVTNVKHKNAKPRLLKFDTAWNLLATRNADHSGYDFSPALKYFDFPLYSGKTWSQTSIETDIKTKAQREHRLSAVVEGWENITVPAGSFKALKVNIQTSLYDPKTRSTLRGSDISWYVPSVKRSVKSETTLTDVNGETEYSLLQLIHYQNASEQPDSASRQN